MNIEKHKLKGSSKQAVILRPSDSKLFEEAIFILRPDTPAADEQSMLTEAERIINAHIFAAAESRSSRLPHLTRRTMLTITLTVSVLLAASILLWLL